jgi:hypothetical protein
MFLARVSIYGRTLKCSKKIKFRQTKYKTVLSIKLNEGRAEYFNKREQMHSAIYKKLKYNENDKISIKISEN